MGLDRLRGTQPWRIEGHTLQVEFQREPATNRWELRVEAGWPTDPPRESLALHEAYAIQVTGTLRTFRGPEAARWKLRLLVAASLIELPDLSLPELPPNAPESAHRTWSAIVQLASIRSLTDDPAGEGMPLSRPWLREWSGMTLTVDQVRYGQVWLERHGFIVRAGTAPSKRGKPIILWRVVDPTTTADGSAEPGAGS